MNTLEGKDFQWSIRRQSAWWLSKCHVADPHNGSPKTSIPYSAETVAIKPYLVQGALHTWLTDGSWDGQIILDYPDGLSVVTEFLTYKNFRKVRVKERTCDDRNRCQQWPVWLSWLGVVPQSGRLPFRFPVRAQAWVVDWSWMGHMQEATNWCFSLMLMFLSISFSLSISLKINKFLKKKQMSELWQTMIQRVQTALEAGKHMETGSPRTTRRKITATHFRPKNSRSAK